jgi:hypothetical protein
VNFKSLAIMVASLLGAITHARASTARQLNLKGANRGVLYEASASVDRYLSDSGTQDYRIQLNSGTNAAHVLFKDASNLSLEQLVEQIQTEFGEDIKVEIVKAQKMNFGTQDGWMQ